MHRNRKERKKTKPGAEDGEEEEEDQEGEEGETAAVVEAVAEEGVEGSRNEVPPERRLQCRIVCKLFIGLKLPMCIHCHPRETEAHSFTES